jgi:hypothetical protein
MRAKEDALATLLATLRRERVSPWRSIKWTVGYRSGDPFLDHADAVCAAPHKSSNAADRGARTADQIRERVSERDVRHMRRTALDLQRLADLEERMSVRAAQAARRRWFILGRLLERAAERDPVWSEILTALISQGELSRAERVLLKGKT